MRKPVPYKKSIPAPKKETLNKKKLLLLIVFELIAILLAVIATAIISLLFKITPFISAAISGAMLIFFSVLIGRTLLKSK